MRVLYADYSNFTFSPYYSNFYSRIVSIGPVLGHVPLEKIECLDLLRSFLVHSWSEVP